MAAVTTPTPIRASDMPEAVPPTERTPQQVSNLLRRPFNPAMLKQRKIAGGRQITYAPVDVVIQRLNRACGEWHWQVVRIEILNLPVPRNGMKEVMPVAHVTGALVIPGLGTRQAVGTAPVDNEDATKIAESDAIKRAASYFGVPCGR